MAYSSAFNSLPYTLVLGATGYTGRLTVLELLRRKQPFAIAGRDQVRLVALRKSLGLETEVPVLVADPTQPATLPALFGPEIGVIINCVGPFTKLGEPVVRAAIEAGVHYLDITGEQNFLARMIALYDGLAQQKGCAIVPACGVEYALSNWAATLAADDLEPLDELWTATAIENVQASRGTQLSLFEALSKPGLGWRDGQRILKGAASSRRWVEFPAPFNNRWAVWSPFGELVTLPRHIRVRNLNSYLALGDFAASGMQLVSPLLPIISPIAGAVLRPFARSPKPGAAEASRWAVVSEARSPKGHRRIVLQGTNVYQLTAIITAWCASKMLAPDFKFKGRGVLGPAQAFDPQEALNYLMDFGLRLEQVA